MPLQNRVDPFGSIHAVSARGAMMGNRGGRIHDPASKTINRRYASRRWIACVCEFKNRRLEVMGKGYTMLFFLDEVTAFAAGHRPCAECRRPDFIRFQQSWQSAFGLEAASKADEMDEVLHRERGVSGAGGAEIGHDALRRLPDGAMIEVGGKAYGIRGGKALEWSFEGYGAPTPISSHRGSLRLLTPPSIVKVFKTGYRAGWHSSAEP